MSISIKGIGQHVASGLKAVGSKTLEIGSVTKDFASKQGGKVASFAKTQADKFVATKPAQFVKNNKEAFIGAAVVTAVTGLAITGAKAVFDKVQEIRNEK